MVCIGCCAQDSHPVQACVHTCTNCVGAIDVVYFRVTEYWNFTILASHIKYPRIFGTKIPTEIVASYIKYPRIFGIPHAQWQEIVHLHLGTHRQITHVPCQTECVYIMY